MSLYGWRGLHAYAAANVRAAFPSVGQSYGGRHSGYQTTWSSWHYRDSADPSVPWRFGGTDGCAVDWGTANSDCWAIYRLLEPLAARSVVRELIWRDILWRDGRKSRYGARDHYDHVHGATDPNFDWARLVSPPKPEPPRDPLALRGRTLIVTRS